MESPSELRGSRLRAPVGLLSVRDGLEDFTGIDVLLGVLDFGPLLDLNPEPAMPQRPTGLMNLA